ncbi:MAG: hypothetical protein RLZZ352_2537 [Pseudomonadota bacterium]|jgi:chromosome segregation ATPase
MGGLFTPFMADFKQLDQITERVERLLLRHQELQHTNEQLRQQVLSLQAERDSLQSRLNAARARIDVLLDRLSSAPQQSMPASQADDTREEHP